MNKQESIKEETLTKKSPQESTEKQLTRIDAFLMWLRFPKTNTEEPTRIKNFHETLRKINWVDIDDKQRLDNLNIIFNALHTLASNDLEYYNKHREKSKRYHKWTIGLSIICSALGAVFITSQNAILIYKFFSIPLIDMPVIGSIFFIIAATVLALNKSLSASKSYIRYVIAQFNLGEEIEQFELDWQQWQIKYNQFHFINNGTDEAFDLFNKFAKFIYDTIRNDTKKWEGDIRNALSEAEKNTKQK